MTEIDKHGGKFKADETYCKALHGYREAVVRWAASIRAHFVARQHTNLVAIVAEEERNHFIMLVKVKRNGEYELTQRLTLETQNAEQKLQARKQRERDDHNQRQGHHTAQRQRN